MATNMRAASADEVREWARTEGWTDSRGREVGERGRVSSELVSAFNAAHKRNRREYVPGTPSSVQATPRDSGSTRATASTGSRANAQSTPAPKRETATSSRSTSHNVQRIPTEGLHSSGEMLNMADVLNTLLSADSVQSGEGRPVLVSLHTLAFIPEMAGAK